MGPHHICVYFSFFFFVNGAVWESTRLVRMYDEVFVVTY